MKRTQLFERLGALEQELTGLYEQLGLQGRAAALPAQPLDAVTLQLIVEYAGDCISVHDPQGIYLFASRAFATCFGWLPQDLIGRSAYEFFHPEDSARVAADHAARNQGHDTQDHDTHSVAYRLRCTNGDYRWVETRSEACVTEQGVQRVICFTRDLTDLFHSIEELRNRISELDLLSGRDDLTGLANRRTLRARLGQLFTQDRRQRPFTLALIDVDFFKHINDTFGHVKGDATLVAVADALARSCRDVDLIARYGGDEFCALYVDVKFEHALELARRQCEAVARLNLVDVYPTISVGVAEYEEGDTVETLLKRADAALYDAKTKGRNQVRAAA